MRRETRWATRVKRSGLPNDSTYSITTAVRSSASHHSSRSLVETSARPPNETNIEIPICRACACPSSPSPGATACTPIASAPGLTSAPLNVAFKLTSSVVLITPTEPGPTIRKPEPRTIANSRSLRSMDATPSSSRLPGSTSSARAPIAAASAANSSTSSPTAAMITSSAESSSSARLRAAGLEHTTPPARLTGITSP